ncbi:MAG: hypothetical protein AB7J35_14875 [Dehalococcoidia bacterium]
MKPTVNEPISLDSLGPLSRPIVFRLYFAAFTGILVLCWAEFLVNEKYVLAGSQFLIFFVGGRKGAGMRRRLPAVAKVSWQSCVLSAVFAIGADFLWHAVFADFSVDRELRLIAYSTVASGWLFVSFGPLSELQWFRPKSPTS